VILPGKRVLLIKSLHPQIHQWSASIEKEFFETDNPEFTITQAVTEILNINLSLNPQTPKATIKPLGYIDLPEHNRIIFPFTVEIKNAITLKLKTWHQFMAEPFNVLLDNIASNTIYCDKSFHTINTVHVIKEAHLKGVLPYVPIKKIL
jgi:hypothetical protein